MTSTQSEFIRFMLSAGALRFGDFTTKSGRRTPYFINTGAYRTGAQLARLGEFYAGTIAREFAGPGFDNLFGPAYKGIPLAVTASIALQRLHGIDVPVTFNRKEAKDHGEGGTVIGAPLRGRVVIVDDVISAGTSVGESVALIRAQGAEPAAVLIALDRMERGGDAERVTDASAVDEVRARYGLPVHAIATLDDLLAFLDGSREGDESHAAHRARIADYRSRFGSRRAPD